MKSFSQVSSTDLAEMFGITITGGKFLPAVDKIPVPDWLNHIIETRKRNLATMRTEKAISEALIAPLLMAVQEMYSDKITVFSGEPMAISELSGVCDFLITKSPEAYEPKGGYFVLVEAKKNDILSGIPQCIAEMYVAQTLNENKDTVYGCVSTGLEWLFIKLEDKIATTHSNVFTISEADTILGIFGWMVSL